MVAVSLTDVTASSVRSRKRWLKCFSVRKGWSSMAWWVPPLAARSVSSFKSIHQEKPMSSSIGRVIARWLMLGAVFVLSTACTSVPTQELSQYRQAFAATQTASEAVLMDFADALHSAAARQRAAVPMAEPAGAISATLEN